MHQSLWNQLAIHYAFSHRISDARLGTTCEAFLAIRSTRQSVSGGSLLGVTRPPWAAGWKRCTSSGARLLLKRRAAMF
jgi:hypothetical protein